MLFLVFLFIIILNTPHLLFLHFVTPCVVSSPNVEEVKLVKYYTTRGALIYVLLGILSSGGVGAILLREFFWGVYE